MLGKRWGIIGLLALGSLAFYGVGCGGSDEAAPQPTNAAGSSGSGAGGEATCDQACTDKYKNAEGVGKPPATPSGASAPSGTTSLIHSVSKLYLGDTKRDDSKSNDAWKDFGFDLDGFKSDKNFSGHCKAVTGGKNADIREDGTDGIDNSFGRNIVTQILTSLVPNAGATVNEQIDMGAFSLSIDMGKMKGVTDKNVSPIASQLFAVAGQEDPNDPMKYIPPTKDGMYKWRPLEELLESKTPPVSKVKITDSYIADGVWVGKSDNIQLSLTISGFSLTLNIKSALIKVKLSADGSVGTDGAIGGLLETEQVVDAIRKVAGQFDPQFCSGSTVDTILNQIRQASDSLLAGGQDAGKTCDSISVGLGFETRESLLGDFKPTSAPGADKCAGK
jgi:hypothetical protein